MERYHILKLGLAITFYAAYCIRPMLVQSLEAVNELDNKPRVLNPEYEYFQYFQGVDGRPGIDFPVYSYIPRTAFNCRGISSGYYADLDTDCQVFHICDEGRKISFLCPNGTIFQQSELICEWWNKVNCTNSPTLYEESAERLQNDVARRKSSRRVASQNGAGNNHGAVMRMEQRSSTRATKNSRDSPQRQDKQRQQKIKDHRIPDNNDIEQQIEQAESNNRHLANVQNSIQTSQKTTFGGQQQRYPNHNYKTVEKIDTSNPRSRSKQIKKDIDRDTGNYINNNNNQSANRQRKRIDQAVKSNYNFGFKTNQEKNSSAREHQVQFSSTRSGLDSATEHFGSRSTTQSRRYPTTFQQHENNGFSSNSTKFHSPETITSKSIYQGDARVGSQVGSRTTYSSTSSNIFTSPSSKSNSLPSSTIAPAQQRKKTEKPLYGVGLKGRYNSFNARSPYKTEGDHEPNQNNYRGTVTYNTNSNYVNVKSNKGQSLNKFSIPVTTYSPPTKYYSFNKDIVIDEKFELPPFPKHKSELNANSRMGIEEQTNGDHIGSLPISSTAAPTINSDQVQGGVLQPNQKPTERQNIVPQNLLNWQNKNENQNLPFNELSPPHMSRNDINHRTYDNHIKRTDDKTYTAGQIPVNVIQPNQESIKIPNKEYPATPHAISRKAENENQDSEETQVVQESSSFVKSSFNSIMDDGSKALTSPYPNHRSTYSAIKDLSFLEGHKLPSISSITPHLVTTQPINNGKPFIGSQVGSTVLPTTQSKYTYLPTTTVSSKATVIFGVLRHNSTTEPPPYGPPEMHNLEDSDRHIPDLFNVGSTDKTILPVEISTTVTNSIPTEIFNIGNTDTTVQSNVLPNIATTTVPPLKIYVPDQGSLNVGQSDTDEGNNYQDLEPVNEPPFVKKTVPVLYGHQKSTERPVDHATVYGTYPSSTQRTRASSTPYSPTVPTITQSSLNNDYGIRSTARTPKAFNQGVPIRFDKNQDKISIHLSKNVGGQTRTNDLLEYGRVLQPPRLRVGAVVHVADAQSFEVSSSTVAPDTHPSGFFVTRGFGNKSPKSKIEKPRPFARNLEFGDRLNTALTTDDGQNTVTSTFPTYRISSARPFAISETTSPTPFITTQTPSSLNVYDNVDNMIGVLQEIANFNSQKEFSEDPRPGLVIPPSVGPQTLHSLAQYFANELTNNETGNVLRPETKERLTTLLTAMTVHGYRNLFNEESTANPTATTTTPGAETTTNLTPSRFENEDTNNSGSENGKTDDNSTGNDELLSTTSLPELRQLARNFSLALSSYLNDPDNFRKSLEGLRPTEPPTLDGSDNVESSTTEDELLNFSDADVKPSTAANPSATWGYILAADGDKDIQEDVKNSLNPDLNTADSQSFVPRFNNVQVDVKQGKGSTDLPPNHWTSSPQATKLWQNALSVNPAVVNDHFETTPSGISVIDEETTEPELFNSDVLPELTEPHSEISYDLRELPPLALNATQVHGILIDFMNHTKSDEHNRLNRILKKLNTSEAEFLDRMKEIESNPLTKRLILLLISECGANISQDLRLAESNHNHGALSGDSEYSSTGIPQVTTSVEGRILENHALRQLVHPHLNGDDQDTRALQLLNSLYTIASKFGKRR